MMAKKRKLHHNPSDTPESSEKLRSEVGGQSPLTTKTSFSPSLNGSAPDVPPIPSITAAMSATVFTHHSLAGNKNGSKNQSASYERLEFLGDAYIELMASRFVWDMFKDLPAGRLSQIRETLVKNETLGEIAVRYGLDKQLSAAPDVRHNAKQWAKVKGDLLEAYVAAVVSTDDQVGGPGYKAAEHWLHQLWTDKLGDGCNEKPPNKHAKVALSKKIVSRNVKLEYWPERPMEQLDGGQQKYFMGAYLTGWGYEEQLLGTGQGLNKTGAGNLAAENALQNPLTEQIAAQKIAYDRKRKLMLENGKSSPESAGSDGPVSPEGMWKQAPDERDEHGRREKELVEQKRNMFMKTVSEQ